METYPVGYPIGISSNGEDCDMGTLRVVEDRGDHLYVKGKIEGELWEGTMAKSSFLALAPTTGENEG